MSKMADSSSTERMAVATDTQLNNQPLKDPAPREELEQRATVNSPRPLADGFPKKKGTFKITSIKLNDADGDSMDDLDESHTEMTEDMSSEILDISKTTDIDNDTPSEDLTLPTQTISTDNEVVIRDQESTVKDTKEKTGADMHSRFRVVKIETKEPFHRGRWICHDFLDTQPPVQQPVASEKSDTKLHEDANSGSSSAGSSIHYVHGVDDPSKNPLIAGATGTIPVSSSQGDLPTPVKHESFQPIHPAPSTATTQQQNMNSSVQGSLGPQSQGQSYYTDSSQNPTLPQSSCQTLQHSSSHQSLSSIVTTDSIGNKSQISASAQGQSTVPQVSLDSSGGNVGNVQQYVVESGSSAQAADSQPGVSGSSSSMQSVYPSNIQSTAQIPGNMTTFSSALPVSQVPMSGTTGAAATFGHLSNPQVSQSGFPDTSQQGGGADSQPTSSIPSNKGDQTSQLGSVIERTLPSNYNIPFNEVLDKDLNVIQNTALLSPLAAVVSGMESPQKEQSAE